MKHLAKPARRLAARLLFLALGLAGSVIHAQEQAVDVDPNELERRTDLVGKLVSVDDRMLYYQFHQGRGYDELRLKRTNVVFRLPPRLRPESPPRPTPLIVKGRLRRDGDQLVCDVASVTTVPADLARVNQAVAALSAKDFAGRKAWAAWASRRGRDFKENALVQRGEELEAEALRVEAEQSRGAVDAPTEWLRLAEDARRRKVPEPEPSAQAHRAFRALLARASASQQAAEVVTSVERFFPDVARNSAAGSFRLNRWEQPYANDPAETYRSAPADARKALDRRLWADAKQKQFELEAAGDPQAAVELSARAEAEIPERPEFASRLLKSGLDLAGNNLGTLRLSEVRSIGQAYQEKLRDPDKALTVYRDWLRIQRGKLSPTDAEGPVDLAGLYEELIQDRTAARELLERAWKIDPGSKAIAEAFRSRGYRRVKDQWVEESANTAALAPGQEGVVSAPPPGGPTRGLRGLTPEEVSQQLRSAPERKVFTGTKGQIVEQWIFRLPTQRRWRFVNFIRTPGELQPRAVSDYTLPETLFSKGLAPSRQVSP